MLAGRFRTRDGWSGLGSLMKLVDGYLSLWGLLKCGCSGPTGTGSGSKPRQSIDV